jgi:hypothetical protein
MIELHGPDLQLQAVSHKLHMHHKNLAERFNQILSSDPASGDREESLYGGSMSSAH